MSIGINLYSRGKHEIALHSANDLSLVIYRVDVDYVLWFIT
jgi:hypothetical protein